MQNPYHVRQTGATSEAQRWATLLTKIRFCWSYISTGYVLIIIKMAAAHFAYPDLAVDKFPGTDPDQDAESFIQLIERKINFALGDAPADAG